MSPAEIPDTGRAFALTNGPTICQFRVRTKTGRAQSLQRAALLTWVELSVAVARRLAAAEGDLTRLSSPRGEEALGMHLMSYLALAERTARHLGTALGSVVDAHPDDQEASGAAKLLAGFADRDADALRLAPGRYADRRGPTIDRLRPDPPAPARRGGVGLRRDLQDLHASASLADLSWTIVGQAARALRDEDLVTAVEASRRDMGRWLYRLTRVEQFAPQTLLTT